MSKVCEICGKGPMSGHIVTHANKKIKRRWLPNLKKIRILINGSPKRAYVCTSCIRSGKIQKIRPRKKPQSESEVA